MYGPAVDQVFAVESASSDPLWALTDHQGTPRDWVEQTTVNGTASTVLAQHIRYTAFGAISSVVDSAGALLDARLSPLVSYTGQLYDADADLMYYRARWYDPVVGKFLNDDPMGFAAGDANVSRYVGNGATTCLDPTGLWPPKDPVINVTSTSKVFVTIPDDRSVLSRPVIVFVYVSPLVGLPYDPGYFLNNSAGEDYKQKLSQIERQLNSLMVENELPHIRFMLLQSSAAQLPQNTNPPKIDATDYVRFDYYMKLVQSQNKTNSASHIAATNGPGFTMDEWPVLYGKGRTVDARPNWPVLYANTIAHEFFTFNVFEHFSDLRNTSALTRQTGKMNEMIELMTNEKWQILKTLEPNLPVSP